MARQPPRLSRRRPAVPSLPIPVRMAAMARPGKLRGGRAEQVIHGRLAAILRGSSVTRRMGSPCAPGRPLSFASRRAPDRRSLLARRRRRVLLRHAQRTFSRQAVGQRLGKHRRHVLHDERPARPRSPGSAGNTVSQGRRDRPWTPRSAPVANPPAVRRAGDGPTAPIPAAPAPPRPVGRRCSRVQHGADFAAPLEGADHRRQARTQARQVFALPCPPPVWSGNRRRPVPAPARSSLRHAR